MSFVKSTILGNLSKKSDFDKIMLHTSFKLHGQRENMKNISEICKLFPILNYWPYLLHSFMSFIVHLNFQNIEQNDDHN